MSQALLPQLLLLALLVLPAQATPKFTGEPEHVAEGAEAAPWERLERLRDPHPKLPEEAFHPKSPHRAAQVEKMFGTDRPSSDTFILHCAPGWQGASGVPVLLVPGANDDATLRFTVGGGRESGDHRLMDHLAGAGLPVFGISFSHPNGDNLFQGEQLANAIQRIRQLMGRVDDPSFQVDVVTHSKGAMPARCYTQDAGQEFRDRKFLTRFRGDVRRILFLGGPLGGIDTPFRYYLYNLTVMSQGWPAPMGAKKMLYYGSMKDSGPSHIMSGCFPGQLQMLHDLRKLDVGYGALSWTLPDANATMNALVDGGTTLFLESEGLDEARSAGGNLIERLNTSGMPPTVAVAALAGTDPVLNDPRWAPIKVPLGIEPTAPSDGLVFVKSALHTEGLTRRGARLIQAHSIHVNHVEMLENTEVFDWITSTLTGP